MLTKPAKSDKTSAGKGRARALYDVPYMFEAREFLRKKLIGKKVIVCFYILINTLYDIPYMFEAREFLRKKLIGKKVIICLFNKFC